MPDPRPLVHIHWLRLDLDGTRLGQLHTLLGMEETARADRFTIPYLRTRFIAAHGQLRELLSAVTGCAGGDLQFIHGPHGKPALANGALEFNLSHSGNIAVLAIAPPGCPVGVDIECRPRRIDACAIARRFFPCEDAKAICESDATRAQTLFFRHWTAREAVMKATGHGLALGPQRIQVVFQGEEGLAQIEPPPPGREQMPLHWHLRVLRDTERMTAVLATPRLVRVAESAPPGPSV